MYQSLLKKIDLKNKNSLAIAGGFLSTFFIFLVIYIIILPSGKGFDSVKDSSMVDFVRLKKNDFLNERQIQLNRFRQQGRNIDSRAEQNASDFAWNNIIERKIKDQKIDELNMQVQPDEVYNFLLLSPPVAFQNNLKELGLFQDNEGNFDLD